MKLKFLTQNSKMKKSTDARVFNFGIPAKETCIGAGICKKYCYAAKGFYLWPSAKNAQHRRWAGTKEDDFSIDMIEDVILSGASHIRIHDSGDFYSREYLSKWLKVIDALPHVTFYAYTKMIPFFKNLELPENFTVIFSYGGIYDKMIDQKTERHASIFKDKIGAGYVDASQNDLNAIGKNKKIGLISH